MPISAAVSLAASTVRAGQQAQCTLTLTNPGSSDVVVTGLQPTVSPFASSVAVGKCIFGGPVEQTVPGGGTLTLFFNVVGHAPQERNLRISPASFDYLVGAVINTNDGVVTNASTATLTVINSL